ncbi:MAG: CBS domain-containing protein [Planctomycetes bacterium]|nr:CBS domain-containing protein [Planctomycetota bacterium]
MTSWSAQKTAEVDLAPNDSNLGVSNGTQAVRDIMQYGVDTVEQDDSVYKAIGILAEKKLSGLPVLDHGQLVGMISEKDVLTLLYHNKHLKGAVKDYMTTQLVTFDIETPVTTICDCFAANKFRRLPILYQDQLAGVVARADLVRANKNRFKKSGTKQGGQADLLAQDVMRCGLLTVTKETAVSDLIDVLVTHHIGGLPVVDDYMNLDGFVSDKDILKLLCDPAAEDCPVEAIMTKKVISFQPDDSLFDVCDCLVENSIHGVPVVKGRKLVGQISRADLMVHILSHGSAYASHQTDGP